MQKVIIYIHPVIPHLFASDNFHEIRPKFVCVYIYIHTPLGCETPLPVQGKRQYNVLPKYQIYLQPHCTWYFLTNWDFVLLCFGAQNWPSVPSCKRTSSCSCFFFPMLTKVFQTKTLMPQQFTTQLFFFTSFHTSYIIGIKEVIRNAIVNNDHVFRKEAG